MYSRVSPPLDFDLANLPKLGDIDGGGGGMTTSSITNETDLQAYGEDSLTQGGAAYSEYGHQADPGSIVAPGMLGVVHPTFTLFGLTAGWAFWEYQARKRDGKGGMIPDTLRNALGVAVVFLWGKAIFGVHKVPGVSEVVEAL